VWHWRRSFEVPPARRPRTLGISPRTVDLHRANLLKRLGAKNTVDLVRKVLGE
jgi:hypothetical protein